MTVANDSVAPSAADVSPEEHWSAAIWSVRSRPEATHRGPRPKRFLVMLSVDWAVIAATAALWKLYPSLWLLPFTAIIVGSRQHGLAVLMHETIHQRLFSRPWLTHTLGRLCAWSLFISWSSFRENHLAHHRFVNSEKDPDLQFKMRSRPLDWTFPKTFPALAVLFFKDLFGYGFVINVRRMLRYRGTQLSNQRRSFGTPPDRLLPRLILTACFIFIWILAFGLSGFMAIWVLPLFTTLPWMLRVRSVAEHFNLSNKFLEQTRVVRAPWIEREFFGFGPHMIGYHASHHLFPTISCHRLKQLDWHLRDDTAYEHGFPSADGYFTGRNSVWRQLRSAP